MTDDLEIGIAAGRNRSQAESVFLTKVIWT
jgi:hypothetical protein